MSYSHSEIHFFGHDSHRVERRSARVHCSLVELTGTLTVFLGSAFSLEWLATVDKPVLLVCEFSSIMNSNLCFSWLLVFMLEESYRVYNVLCSQFSLGNIH